MQDLLQVRAYSDADFSDSDNSLINRIEEYLLVQGKIIDSKSVIFDVGCGPGNITERLSARWPYSRIIGIDGSEAMLAVARNRKKQGSSGDDLSKVNYYNCEGAIINVGG